MIEQTIVQDNTWNSNLCFHFVEDGFDGCRILEVIFDDQIASIVILMGRRCSCNESYLEAVGCKLLSDFRAGI